MVGVGNRRDRQDCLTRARPGLAPQRSLQAPRPALLHGRAAAAPQGGPGG